MLNGHQLLIILLVGGLLFSLLLSFHTLWTFDGEVTIEDASLLYPTDNVLTNPHVVVDETQHNDNSLHLHKAPDFISSEMNTDQQKHVVQCRPVALNGKAYSAVPSRRGEWHDRETYGPRTGVLDDQYCDCVTGTADVTVRAPKHATVEASRVNPRARSALRGAWRESAKNDATGASIWNNVYCDEVRTSACSMDLVAQAVFMCSSSAGNSSSRGDLEKKTFVFASRVWDGVCDCCDGTDEVGGPWNVACANTCNRGESVNQATAAESWGVVKSAPRLPPSRPSRPLTRGSGGQLLPMHGREHRY